MTTIEDVRRVAALAGEKALAAALSRAVVPSAPSPEDALAAAGVATADQSEGSK